MLGVEEEKRLLVDFIFVSRAIDLSGSTTVTSRQGRRGLISCCATIPLA